MENSNRLSDNVPVVQVGIMSAPTIEFNLYGKAWLANHLLTVENNHNTATVEAGKVLWNGIAYDELLFEPQQQDSVFELQNVTIGVNFHWEKRENQRFAGLLKLIVEGENLTAVNVINIEDYLTSVISSEMSANASLELLKAHSVISRSWLLSAMEQRHKEQSLSKKDDARQLVWYERDAHTNYDVCADDHCQRYQGITRASTDIVRLAIEQTRGQVLAFDGAICDARYSKCCGGAFEEFQYCWDDELKPYLAKGRDSIEQTDLPDLTDEANAEHWILSKPDAFCNTSDRDALKQVLNDYDLETKNFYRWTATYTQTELSDIVRERSGNDYGDIIDLIPIARGTSGRLWQLKIVGTKLTRIIGKELEIRRILSRTHLLSSAFIVRKEDDKFVLIGAGWGHGVGLCQIGAAMMSVKGYTAEEILNHYYRGAEVKTLY